MFPSFFPLLCIHLNHQQMVYHLWYLQNIFRITPLWRSLQNIPAPSHHHFSPRTAPTSTLLCCAELIQDCDKGRPSTEFPQYYSQCDARTCMREHTSPLLGILPWIPSPRRVNAGLSTGLGPAASPTSALPPFLLLIYSCFLGPNKHAMTPMLLHPLFPNPDIQWALPSLISGLCSEVTSIVRLSLTTQMKE